jgi:hypothetical protein
MQARPTMPIIRTSILLISTCLIAPGSYAENIYKTIDNNGNVSYSSSPPAANQQSEKITVPPPPSDDDVNSAKNRHKKNLKAEKIYSDSRLQREQKVAEDARIRKEKQESYTPPQQNEKAKDEGPYYGIPGRGILVLPKGPRINR